MELLFLVIVMAVFLALDTIMENILWIGGIFIFIILTTLIRQFRDIFKFGLDFGEFTIILLKLGAIAVTVWLMTFEL